MLAADWTKDPESEPRVDVYLSKDLKVTGANYKVLSEDVAGVRFGGTFMLDDLKLDVCFDFNAYWQGPKGKTPASVKFDTILSIVVRKIRLKNNHQLKSD